MLSLLHLYKVHVWKYSYYTQEIGTSILCQVLKMKVRRLGQEANSEGEGQTVWNITVRDPSGTATEQGECPTNLQDFLVSKHMLQSPGAPILEHTYLTLLALCFLLPETGSQVSSAGLEVAR